MLRGRALPAREAARHGQVQGAAASVGQLLRLIEATLAPARGVDGYRHEHVSTPSGVPPTLRHHLCQGRDKTALAVIFERVDGGPHRARERGTPFQLDDAVGKVNRQPDRRTGGLRDAAPERQAAGFADDRAFPVAARAAGREQQIQHGAHTTQPEPQPSSRDQPALSGDLRGAPTRMIRPMPSEPSTWSPVAGAQRFRRLAWPALLVATGLAAAWLVLLPVVFRTSPGWGYDLEAYLLAAQRLAHGASIYLPQTLDGPFQPGPFGLYLYAPPLAVGMLPFTALSASAATTIWFALRAALLVGAIYLMPVRRWIRLLVFVLAVVSEPVLTDLNLGNVSVIVMGLSIVAWRYLDRPPNAVAVAAVMAVRPTFGLFLIWWLLRRRWRQVLVCLAAGVALIVVSLPFVGPSAYADYLRLVRNLSDVTGVAHNLDLGSTVARLGLAGTPATVALVAGYAAAVAAVLLSLRRDREVSFMVTLGATLLVSPILQDHFLVSALIPAAFLLERGRRWGVLLAVGALLWVPAPAVPLIALAAMLAPFLAPPRGEPAYAAASKRTTSPT